MARILLGSAPDGFRARWARCRPEAKNDNKNAGCPRPAAGAGSRRVSHGIQRTRALPGAGCHARGATGRAGPAGRCVRRAAARRLCGGGHHRPIHRCRRRPDRRDRGRGRRRKFAGFAARARRAARCRVDRFVRACRNRRHRLEGRLPAGRQLVWLPARRHGPARGDSRRAAPASAVGARLRSAAGGPRARGVVRRAPRRVRAPVVAAVAGGRRQ